MNSDLVRTPDGSLSVSGAKEALEEITDFDLAKDFSDRATAAIAYFQRAKDSRHLAVQAMQIRLWSERRAGWILLDDGMDPSSCGDFARSIGTTPQALRRWMDFARADEGTFSAVIDEIVVRDGELGITAVDRRLKTKDLERVERGIYRNYLGTFVLRWRDRGVSRQQTVGVDLQQARHQLLVVTGKVAPASQKTRERKPVDEVVDAYMSIRQILQRLDRVYPQLSPALRKQVEEACSGLYRAEDVLGAALRITG